MKPTLLIITGIALILWHCTPETIGIAPDQRPVVAAYLVAGQPFAVTVTKQIPFGSDTTGQGQPINGLIIRIKAADQTITLKSAGNGVYRSDAAVLAKAGQTCELSFDYLGQTVTGTTLIPTRPANVQQDLTELIRAAGQIGNGGVGAALAGLSQAVTLTWNNPAADYYYTVVDNIETTLVPILANRNGQAININRRFQTQPTQGSSTQIQALTFSYFGRHRVVLFHLNPDYAALYKQNSTSTQNISTPATTVVNGLGIFTGMNTDTLYINVKAQ